jgi:hypothetical protein
MELERFKEKFTCNFMASPKNLPITFLFIVILGFLFVFSWQKMAKRSANFMGNFLIFTTGLHVTLFFVVVIFGFFTLDGTGKKTKLVFTGLLNERLATILLTNMPITKTKYTPTC